MNTRILYILCAAMMAWLPSTLVAQNNGHTLPGKGKAASIVVPGGVDVINLNYSGGITLVPVLANCGYTLTAKWADGETPWFTLSQRKPGSWKIKTETWFQQDDRTGQIIATLDNGTTRTITVRQKGVNAIDNVTEDFDYSLFTDQLCNELKPGTTQKDIERCNNPYAVQLANYLLNTDYSTEFRVGTFSCYENRNTLQQRLKTSNAYDNYENPTGIYFERGEKAVIFATGIDEAHPVRLCIKCFSNAADIATEGQPESYYDLKNGINIITATNRGNGYVSYYSNDYANAPDIRLHFAMATESGYFDASRHTDADWVRLLANVKSDIFDILTQRLHVAAPVKNLKSKCPTDGERLAAIYDQVVYREREIMGLPQRGIEPRNHQFARPVAGKMMFADGMGAASAFGSFNEWVNPNNFGFWGIAHELGHNNQITPGFKWSGCGETTNNIYASWVEHKVGAKDAFGNGHHRLEDEVSGIDSYSGMRGGRFEAYLEEGVRKGISWQLQDGPDYHGTKPNTVTVPGQDADGKSTGTVTTTSRNYDHFLKVVPFWQLSLWSEEVGAHPGGWGNFIQSYRDGFSTVTFNTNGKQQMEMVRRLCDAMQTDLIDFFEKAGILKPINAYIEDYGPGWSIITQEMCDEVKTYVRSKGYPAPPAALNYINAYNWTRFRDQVALTDAGLNRGASYMSNQRVRIDNSTWKGAVAYETYNENDELVRITMFGLGDTQMSDRYTYVLFPSGENAKYIMAVGFDGTRVKCYEK